ncbi:hypothetical protein QN372_03145 [Undibacterium sp. RTI2.1]|uniref:hypothetical protein n=1 Tax=unclassified Undibacterium TaxID=2630295 RepID=UPI002AB42680|nr:MULTISPECIES: hypothetical protein [unclassified Undibacterium]MDY7540604.1 hypothetical protein [Undibacterium sp. 5I1]MEB0029732.1 hypothetical protein [Undibacterium sp. RTI2.1]MEB0117476.1 hypothetical protein [Undibacterium sp. RTI2.2]MEB0230781.1 hypothetical protein [Undibacterium sp. 10I3]MEB0256570.1 hypothetical protein [Undibacterium sp. 5I1]
MNEATYSKRDKEIAKKYRKELSLSFVLYVIVLLVSITYAKPMADSLLRTLIVMTPVIPAFGALWAIVRNFKRMDDYVRVWLLEVVAISGAITAFFSFSYGFLEGIGFPKLSGFVTYGIFMGSWCLIIGIRKILEREK